MNKKALFTIVSKNYLSFGRTVLNSAKKHNDDIDIFLLLADECDGYFDKENEDFTVIESKALNIKNYEQMAFRYNIVEFNTSLKPFFIKYLFEQGYDKILYLDPDIMVFDSLEFIYELLDLYSIILTPHLSRPPAVNESCFTMENMFLLAGTFNLGFLGIANSSDSNEIIDWWARKCVKECIIDSYHTGCFVDQKWCTLFSGFSDKVYVLRHQGCNMAIWNLHERRLNNGLVNENYRLIFYHFSGFDPDNINSISKYQTIYSLNNRPDLEDIFKEYAESIMYYGYNENKNWPYKYSYFNNNKLITPIARQLYTNVEELFPHPFISGSDSYYKLAVDKKLVISNKNKNNTKATFSILSTQNRYELIFDILFKILLKIIGPSRYPQLMDFFRKLTDIRKQDYLLK